VSTRPTASELLATPDALLTRSHLRELGLERRAVDAVFRRCESVVVLEGYSRPMIQVKDYRALIERSRHDGRTRVR
jgi:hypothetical protein